MDGREDPAASEIRTVAGSLQLDRRNPSLVVFYNLRPVRMMYGVGGGRKTGQALPSVASSGPSVCLSIATTHRARYGADYVRLDSASFIQHAFRIQHCPSASAAAARLSGTVLDPETEISGAVRIFLVIITFYHVHQIKDFHVRCEKLLLFRNAEIMQSDRFVILCGGYYKSNQPISLKRGIMTAPTNRKNLLTFGGDPVQDTDSGSLFHFLQHCGIWNFRRFISISHTVTGRFS